MYGNCVKEEHLRICLCLACVYRVMDAREKFAEQERCVRVARGDISFIAVQWDLFWASTRTML